MKLPCIDTYHNQKVMMNFFLHTDLISKSQLVPRFFMYSVIGNYNPLFCDSVRSYLCHAAHGQLQYNYCTRATKGRSRLEAAPLRFKAKNIQLYVIFKQ